MLPIYTLAKANYDYDGIPAGYYHEVMLHGGSVQRFWHRRKFDEVANRIKPGEKVLDYGCGPGSFLHILSERLPDVEAVGLDVGGQQIEYARKCFAKDHPCSAIEFVAIPMQFNRLPFNDATFDVVTCIEVLEHVPPFHALTALMEARRLLKPGGRLIVTTPNYRSLWPFIEMVLTKLSPVKYQEQHISKFTPNAFVKFLETCGYEIVNFGTIFLISPFTAVISERLAVSIMKSERKILPSLGSLLVVEARVWTP